VKGAALGLLVVNLVVLAWWLTGTLGGPEGPAPAAGLPAGAVRLERPQVAAPGERERCLLVGPLADAAAARALARALPSDEIRLRTLLAEDGVGHLAIGADRDAARARVARWLARERPDTPRAAAPCPPLGDRDRGDPGA